MQSYFIFLHQVPFSRKFYCRYVPTPAVRGGHRLTVSASTYQQSRAVTLPVGTLFNSPELQLCSNFRMKHSRKAAVQSCLVGLIPSLRSWQPREQDFTSGISRRWVWFSTPSRFTDHSGSRGHGQGKLHYSQSRRSLNYRSEALCQNGTLRSNAFSRSLGKVEKVSPRVSCGKIPPQPSRTLAKQSSRPIAFWAFRRSTQPGKKSCRSLRTASQLGFSWRRSRGRAILQQPITCHENRTGGGKRTYLRFHLSRLGSERSKPLRQHRQEVRQFLGHSPLTNQRSYWLQSRLYSSYSEAGQHRRQVTRNRWFMFKRPSFVFPHAVRKTRGGVVA